MKPSPSESVDENPPPRFGGTSAVAVARRPPVLAGLRRAPRRSPGIQNNPIGSMDGGTPCCTPTLGQIFLYIYIYYIPSMTSIFEGESPKTKPFSIKTRVIKGLQVIIYIYYTYFLNLNVFLFGILDRDSRKPIASMGRWYIQLHI